MKIIVLNGSPKGMISVTMQYVHYIQKHFPEHELKIINVTNQMKKIKKGGQIFENILEEVRLADGMIWATPVYYLLVPANYKHFIELIFEREEAAAFKKKPAAVLTTSVKFYDHTAHNYLNAICDDLNMNFMGCYSADMADLKKAKERDRLRLFAENFFYAIENETTFPKRFAPVTWQTSEYRPGQVKEKVNGLDKKILVITDSEKHQTNLRKMVEQLTRSFSTKVEVVNLHEVDVKGSCLGCLQCGYDNHCTWEEKDGFVQFFNSRVKTADILIFAGTIKDRYLSCKWKCFFDRSFFNNHVPVLIGKQVGFMISGPLRQLPNLRQILETYVEFHQANLVGFVTDEERSKEIDKAIQNLASYLVRFARQQYIKPRTFLSIGGLKVLRDEVYSRLRFVFRADYLAYRRLRLFDFPQKDYSSRIFNMMMPLLKLPVFRQEMNKRMTREMIKPLKKIIDK